MRTSDDEEPRSTRKESGQPAATVKVWDAATGKERLVHNRHTNDVMALAFSPDGGRVASVSADQTVKPWDAAFFVRLLREGLILQTARSRKAGSQPTRAAAHLCRALWCDPGGCASGTCSFSCTTLIQWSVEQVALAGIPARHVAAQTTLAR